MGGAAGTAAREALVLALPAAGGIPTTILAINVAGAFLLGALLTAVAGGSPRLTLILGTGALGGFTTYSALATDVALLVGNPSPWLGIGYGVLTLALGAVATWLGIAAASGIRRRRQHDPTESEGSP